MSVEFITYKKKKLPVKVGYIALKRMRRETKVDLATGANDDFEIYEPLLYYSLQQGFKIEKKEFTFEREEMEEILEECFFEFTEIVTNFFPPEFLAKIMGEGGMAK